jgi:radical SAM superfamily enzyme YgiQ (UPF0313 family)
VRVLFLNPPFHPRFSREQRSPAVTKSDTLYYPKWLAHAAGVAIERGHEVDLIDAPAWEVDTQYVIDRIVAKGSEAVVCDTSTPSIVNDLRVVREIQAACPGLHIMLVGRHVSALTLDTMKHAQHLDYLAVKEYEFTVADWLEALASGASMEAVEGMVWRTPTGEIATNPPRTPLHDLDQLPFVTEVYKRFLRVEDYFYGHSLHPLVVFDTSRGCPFRCSFCVYPQTFSGHVMRYRSVANVADEFEYVARELPQVRTVMLEDDTFIIDRDRTLELAQELVRRGNKLPFDSNCRADIGGDAELMSELKRAGARLFCVGFESGDQHVLKHMRKGLKLDKAGQFVDACKDAGIMIHGCFMVGNLNETQETMRNTLEYAKSVNPDTAQFFPIMVYPGTAAYAEAKAKGYIETEDYSAWLTEDGLHNSVVNLPHLTHEDLVRFCDKARREFYLRPSYLWHKLGQSLRSRDEFRRNLKGFSTLVRYLIRGSFSEGNRDDAYSGAASS